jgi:hypothetical protein
MRPALWHFGLWQTGRIEGLMSIPGAGSGVERHGKRVTRTRQIPSTAAIAAAVVIAMAITPPAFAQGGTGGGGHVSGSNGGASHQPSSSATRTANQNVSGAPNTSGAGSARQLSSSGGREGWHRGGTPPGWAGTRAEARLGRRKQAARVSHRDHDFQWRDRKFDRRAETGDHERAPFEDSQFERR